ncbi:MAG: hypothetical protein K2J12_09580 [Muribaculaceae bacterium]|nr:hypothetical protein [Muribaculaceae bacterium]
MKKFLLSCLAVAAFATTASATDPTIYLGSALQRISPNGNVAVSEVYGTVTIFNLKDGTQTSFGPNDESITEYSIGNGNSINADGSIILLSVNYDQSVYFENGELHELTVPNPNLTNSFNGITPDGSRICGNVGYASMDDAYADDVTMNAPAYWDRNADGKGYGTYNLLPAPKLDFFGRAPQYVKAIAISSDGKTIAGQITDARGMYHYPIIYQQDNQGKWSYSLPTEKLFNPDKIPFVEYPGEGKAEPSPAEFMTSEKKEAYDNAVLNWDWSSGDPYPDYKDYMTEQEIAKYDEAIAQFETEQAQWQEKWDSWNEFYNNVIESSPNFQDNNVFLSTDGKKTIGTLCRVIDNPDPMAWVPWIEVYTPCSVDIATGQLTMVDTEISCAASGVADNDIIFASNEVGAMPMTGYIIKDGQVQTIEEYIASRNPAYGAWIKENMLHEVMKYEYNEDTEDWEEVFEELTFTGVPVATPDLSIVIFWNDRAWDDGYEYFAESVLFDMSATGGVNSITASEGNLSVDEKGNLIVPAGFESVQVYNVSGACVKSVDAPAGIVELNLANGVYVVKGNRNDGSVSVIKISK